MLRFLAGLALLPYALVGVLTVLIFFAELLRVPGQ